MIGIFTEEKLKELKQEFKDLVASTIHREGINELMTWLENSDFYEAPASSKFHGTYPGGLLSHSINVYKAAKTLLEKAKSMCANSKLDHLNSITPETLAISTLFHDLCKVKFYHPETKYFKDHTTNQWAAYVGYICKDMCPLGHGEKSVIILQQFMKLTGEEMCAIRWHMGMSDAGAALSPYEKPALLQALNNIPLVPLIMEADMFATFTMEEEIDLKVTNRLY